MLTILLFIDCSKMARIRINTRTHTKENIALSSNERHFEIWFPKKKTITFFWSKLSKLHKKDPILHVATTSSLKQGETRTCLGPIPHPLRKGLRPIMRNNIIFSLNHYSCVQARLTTGYNYKAPDILWVNVKWVHWTGFDLWGKSIKVKVTICRSL